MASGTVLLTNKQASDRFVIGATAVSNGSTGTVSGIAYTVTETAGTIQIALSGNATNASYAALINSIKFENTSDAPAAVDRTITVTVSDGIETSNVATALIHVIPVNDAPAGTPADQTSADGQPVTIDVGAAFTDAEGDDIDYTISGLPAGLTFDPETGVISGTLGPNASQGGASGVYTVTVDATDGTDTTMRTFSLTITNPPPVAVADARTTHENISQITGNVLTNDHDTAPDADTLTVSAGQNASGGALPIGTETTLPSGAKLTLNADGSYTYKPNGAFEGLDTDETGTDAFTYTASDGQGGTATTTVTITIDGRNDTPQAGTLPNITGKDGDTVSLNLGALVSDPDVEPLTFAISGLPAGLNFNPSTGLVTGQIDYSASQNGLFTALGGGMIYMITVSVSDGDAEITRTFQYTVTNPAPDAQDDAFNALEDGPNATGSIFSNNGSGADVDGASDGDALTLTAVNGAAGSIGQPVAGSNGGLITIAANGTITFNPNGNFEDLDAGETRTTSVTYTISDGQGGTDTATVTFTVTGSNDAPIATDNTNSVGEDAISPVAGNVQTNNDGFGVDGDPDIETLYVTDVNGSAVSGSTNIAGLYGMLTLNPDGTYSYALNNALAAVQGLGDGQILTETFAYTLADGLEVTVPVNNSSLEGTAPSVSRDTHNATLPPNWTPIQTPDVFNSATNFNGYTWAPTPDGGDFLHALDSGTGYREGFSQTLTGLTPGQTYTINFSQSIGANTFGPSGDGHWQVTAAGQTFNSAAMTTPTLGTAAGWQSQSITFTATAVSTTLSFTAFGTGANRVDLGIDGITVTSAPAGGVLTDTANLIITITGSNDAPVAADDSLAANENGPAVTLNVISGPGIDTDAEGDTLSVSEVGGMAANVGAAVAGSNGGLFTIGSDGALSFNPNGGFEDLAQGETRTSTVTYTVSDGHGGTDTATVTVTVTGSNDAPVVIDPVTGLTANDPNAIVPQQAVADSAAITPLDVTPFFTDPDASDTLTLSINPATLPTGIAFDPLTGTFSGTPHHSASQGGPNGDGLYPIVVTATDPYGATVTTTVVFAISNPAPIAANDDLAGTENQSLSGSVFTANGHGVDSDPDGDSFAVSAVDGSAANIGAATAGSHGGAFTISATGTYGFAPGTDFDDLAQGETRVTSIAYTISDGEGGFDTATVSVTVTGTNDTPFVIDPATGLPPADPNAIIPAQNNSDSEMITPLDVRPFFTDKDTSDALTLAVDPASLPQGITFDPATGTFSGTIQHEASQGGPNSDGIYPIIITATDPYGATTTTTVVFTIINPPPVAVNDSFATTENAGFNGTVFADNSAGADYDPDGDTFIVSAINGSASDVGQPVTGTNGGTFTLGSTGALSFVPGTDFDDLAQGETRTTSVSYTIDDGNGGSSTASVTVTVTGTNDTPYIIDPVTGLAPSNPAAIVPAQAGADGAPITPLNVTGFFTDTDTSDTLVLSVDPAAVPGGLIFNPATGTFSGTPTHDASQGSSPGQPAGTYVIPVTATDPYGATATTFVVFTITNPAPVANNDTGTVSEDGPAVSGDALTNDTDAGGDTDTLIVAAVNGDPSLVGEPVAGSTGGRFTLKADGTWSFDPGLDFDNLAAGDTRDTVITYRMSDGQGGTAEATITVTVTGVNDAPVALGPIAPQTRVEGSPITPIDTTVGFSNPTAAPLTYTATNLPEGLAIDPATGVISGTPANDASVSGPYTVMVTATTPTGETATIALQIGVANPPPLAVDDRVTTLADTPLTIVPLANDSDPDHDPLRVTDITPPANGTAAINPDGTISYVPNAGFTGTETITYAVSDGQGVTTTATITITVGTPSADAPIVTGAVPAQAGTDGAPITPINAGGLFTDPNGGSLVFTAVGLPSGLAIDPVTGVITGNLEPDASVGGPYAITVTGVDPDGNQVSTTFVLGVANPALIASNDGVQTPADTAVTLAPLANDSDPDGDTLSISHVSTPAHGTVTINPDGTLNYTPNAGFTGTETLTYTVSDGEGGTDIATIAIVVGTPLAGAPETAIASITQSPQDGAPIAAIDMGPLFTDPAGQPLTFTATGLPDGLEIDRNTGIVTGTLEPGASVEGPYNVVVTATDPDGNQVSTTLILTPTNPSPLAHVDTASVNPEQPVSIGVLANDLDSDGDTLSVTNASDPAHGSVVVNPDGTITYTPDAGFTGTDTFTYRASDGNGGTVTATVTVNVGTPSGLTAQPAAAPVSGTDGAEIAPFTVSAAFGDPDHTGPLALSVDTAALPPGISFNPATGEFSGTPAADASQGATPGEAPGTYVVPVTATDANGAATTTYVAFTFVNLAPVAVNDAGTASEDDPVIAGNVTTDALTGDADTAPDSDAITVVSAVQGNQPITLGVPFKTAGGGVLTVNADGSYSFVPGKAYNGLDAGETVTETITYTISDGNGGLDTATLVITVEGVNDAPVVVNPKDPGTPENPKQGVDPLNIIPDVRAADGKYSGSDQCQRLFPRSRRQTADVRGCRPAAGFEDRSCDRADHGSTHR